MRFTFSVYLVRFIFVLFFFTSAEESYCQKENEGTTTRAVVYQGDTIPYIELKTVPFIAPKHFKNKREKRRYTRLVYNIKKVYPYARLAGLKYRQYSEELSQIESESERKKMTKQIEQEIKEQFEDDLKKLTISQGHILIKLIDRETQHSSYDLLKDFRGIFTAVFWQSFGRIFGYNLKTKYDPEGEDKNIEEVVQLIERGLL
ncbi:MAG: DUF4294 domain-containing protein [Bacteroidales bacterium]